MGEPKKKAPWLERCAAILGAVIALSLFGVLGWEATEDSAGPPWVSVGVERVVATRGGYTVEVRASNRSNATAADVVIEAELGGERSEATLDYIPGRSSRTAGFFFAHDPRRGALKVRALGYTTP